ncbi:MAG: hypothetical protein U0V48_06345 [Anaerolineales bacterium]
MQCNRFRVKLVGENVLQSRFHGGDGEGVASESPADAADIRIVEVECARRIFDSPLR